MIRRWSKWRAKKGDTLRSITSGGLRGIDGGGASGEARKVSVSGAEQLERPADACYWQPVMDVTAVV